MKKARSFISSATVSDLRRFSMHCPGCRAPVLQGTHSRSHTSQRERWLERLGESTSDLVSRLPDFMTKEWDIDLYSGECSYCGESCMLLELKIAPQTPDCSWRNFHFHENGNRGPEENRMVSWSEGHPGAPSAWIMQSFRTPIGRLDCHLIGPFAVRGGAEGREVDMALRIIRTIWKDISLISRSELGSKAPCEPQYEGELQCL